MRLPFFQIPEDTYLFPAQVRTGGSPNAKEEPVRQWCAFELIREYGISVTDLEFEAKVQIGSKPKRIDILVRRSGKPWAVVECKARQSKGHEKAMVQAESYAVAPTIRAEFVVCTNGDEWIVRRNVNGSWFPAVDLPKQHDHNPASEDFTELLRSIDEVRPLLAHLDATIEGASAEEYFASFQEFFAGANSFTFRIDRDLQFALDNLLRVISTRGHDDDHYHRGKLLTALRSFEAFRSKRALGYEIYAMEGDDTRIILHSLGTGLSAMLDSISVVACEDDLALHIAIALVRYAGQQTKAKPFPETSSALHQSIREFLEIGFAQAFNAKLPSYIDHLSMADLRATAGESLKGPNWLKSWLSSR